MKTDGTLSARGDKAKFTFTCLCEKDLSVTGRAFCELVVCPRCKLGWEIEISAVLDTSGVQWYDDAEDG